MSFSTKDKVCSSKLCISPEYFCESILALAYSGVVTPHNLL